MVKNLPANSGDMGSISDPGISHVVREHNYPASALQSVVVQSLGRVRLFATLWTTSGRILCPSPSPGACPNSCPMSTQPVLHNKRSQKPTHHQWRVAPTCHNQTKPGHSFVMTQHNQEKKKNLRKDNYISHTIRIFSSMVSFSFMFRIRINH